jgi:hypothetical protein
MGAPVEWSDILEKMTLQNKDEFLEKVKQREQAASQQQEQMAKLQMQQLQVDNETKLSYAKSQDSLANERTAKIELDKAVNAERLNRSHEEKTAAALNMIKAAKELDTMDTDKLAKEVNIISQIQQMLQPEEKEEEKEAKTAQAST